MSQANRKYKATFVLDTRGREESLDQLVDKVKADITAAHGQVLAVESLGQRDFARLSDGHLAAAPYVQVEFSAPVDGPRHLRERLRLNPVVHRVMVQSA